jgi:hypothetical protein
VIHLVTFIGQASRRGGAAGGMSLLEKAKQGGWYPLLVIGGIVILVGVFVLIVKMRSDS